MDFDVQSLIATVGVPGALCFYVMMTLRKSVDANTQALYMLANKMGVEIPTPKKGE